MRPRARERLQRQQVMGGMGTRKQAMTVEYATPSCASFHPLALFTPLGDYKEGKGGATYLASSTALRN